jgi:hypothetical protein
LSGETAAWTAHVAEVFQTEFDAFADDAFVLRDGWADKIGVSSRTESSLNVAVKPLFGQFHPVAGNAREADFERVAVRADALTWMVSRAAAAER